MGTRRTFQLAFVLSAIALSGCSSYHLGEYAETPFKTLYIAPVINDSYAPQTQNIFTQHLRQAFLNNGRVKLVNHAQQADATLHITIKNFDRSPTAVESSDTGIARSFSLGLTASSELRDQQGTPYFKDREISASISTLTDSGSQPSEYQDMPVLARKLSDRIVDTVLGSW